jgi:hypothetical protein
MLDSHRHGGFRHPGGHAHVFVPTRCMPRPTRCLVGFSVATAKTVLVRYVSPHVSLV